MGDIVHFTHTPAFRKEKRECYPAIILRMGDPGPRYASIHLFGGQHAYKTIATHGLRAQQWHTREECVTVERKRISGAQ